MARAWTLTAENFLFLCLGKNSSLTETSMVKARTAKVGTDGT